MPDIPAAAARFLTVPAKTFWRVAALGALMILPVGLAAAGLTVLGAGAPAGNVTIAFLGSSLPEELCRFGVLYVFVFRRVGFDRPMDGVIYGAAVSLGFSLAENAFYALALGGAIGALKLLVATPIHLALGMTMGGLLAIAGAAPGGRRGRMTALALGLPVALHGVYDFALLTALAQAGTEVSAASRLAAPAICYAVVIGFAVTVFRRVRGRAAA